jgi:hypothetical protein
MVGEGLAALRNLDLAVYATEPRRTGAGTLAGIIRPRQGGERNSPQGESHQAQRSGSHTVSNPFPEIHFAHHGISAFPTPCRAGQQAQHR